jgi:hypothetical protein
MIKQVATTPNEARHDLFVLLAALVMGYRGRTGELHVDVPESFGDEGSDSVVLVDDEAEGGELAWS